MTKVLLILLALVLLVGCTITITVDPSVPTPEVPFPTPTQEVVMASVRVMVLTLNVREGPGTNYAITRKVHDGDILLIVDEQGDWLQTDRGDWVINTFVEYINE